MGQGTRVKQRRPESVRSEENRTETRRIKQRRLEAHRGCSQAEKITNPQRRFGSGRGD